MASRNWKDELQAANDRLTATLKRALEVVRQTKADKEREWLKSIGVRW
ncbi:MAG: hypothetical protein WA045_10465 [Nitrospira sp.]